jgi:hypothetical protein
MPLEFWRFKDYFMSDETAIGLAGTVDNGGRSQGSRGQPAPLQSRAKFLENWNWLSVTQINNGLCERGRAQQGINKETHSAVAEEWEKRRTSEVTLLETFQFLKSCHRRAPFLFFNGNTFAEIGRALANALFSDLSFHRRKETSSSVAHFITGVLDENMMVEAIDTLSATADWKPGDRVKSLRGSLHGKILRVLKDGKIVWQPDGTKSELTALPESLCADKKRKG